MRVRYVGHACLSIEVAGQRVLTDPWWNGAAYTGQWHQYPLPRVEPEDREHVDFIYISHAHEDHLHIPTLRTIDKKARIVIPRHRDPGMYNFLGSLGFADVIEIGHGQTHPLSPGLDATLYINKDDSILVLEGDGRTLVHVNDALHASSRHVIEHFSRQIRSRHPRIEMLFVGHGSASWFPNCLQLLDGPRFDAARREEVLAQNFAFVTRQLNPRMVFPLSSSFVLLEDHLNWINAVRLRTESPIAELRRQGEHDVLAYDIMPGDCIAHGQVRPGARRRPVPEVAEAEIRTLFSASRAEIIRKKAPDDERIEHLQQRLRANALKRARRVLRRGCHIVCRIDLRDMPEVSFLIDATRDHTQVERCDSQRRAPMVMTTRLEILETLVKHTFGYESITVGYGATLQLRRRDMRFKATLLHLLGRKPLKLSRAEMLALWIVHPWRCFDAWRREMHWRALALRVRQGKVRCCNHMYAPDPERWSPLPKPLQRRSA